MVLLILDKFINMIIGVTGTFGAGKDTVAEYLIEKGFFHFSLSDALRKEMDKRGIPKNIDNMTTFANDFRIEKGHDILARLALEEVRATNATNIVITSIRNPKEAEFLKTQDDFMLIAVNAPIEIRYERIKSRKREGDEVTFEKFKAQEQIQMEGGEGKQNLGPLIKMADYTLINDGTLKEFKEKIDKLISNSLP